MAIQEKYSEIKYFQKGKFSIWLYKNYLPENLDRYKIYIIKYRETDIQFENEDITNFIFLDELSIEIKLTNKNKTRYVHIFCDEENGAIHLDQIEEIDSEIENFYYENCDHEYIYMCDSPEEFEFWKKESINSKLKQIAEHAIAKA